MDRREFLAAAGTVAAVATASQAFAQTGEAPMHPPKYKALEEAASHCVATQATIASGIASACMR